MAEVEWGGPLQEGVNLRGANLSNADLTAADLTGADLSEADLRGANLVGTKLRGVLLIDTQIDDTTLLDSKWRLVWQLVNQGEPGKIWGAWIYPALIYGASICGALT